MKPGHKWDWHWRERKNISSIGTHHGFKPFSTNEPAKEAIAAAAGATEAVGAAEENNGIGAEGAIEAEAKAENGAHRQCKR